MRFTETGLLDRLGHLFAGTRVAANIRKASVREKERDRAEAAVHFQTYVRGREREKEWQVAILNLSVKIFVIKFLHQSKIKLFQK